MAQAAEPRHPKLADGFSRGCRDHLLLGGAEFVGSPKTKEPFAPYSTVIPYAVPVEGVPLCLQADFRHAAGH